MGSNPLQPIPKDLQDGQIQTFADLFCGIGGFHYAAAALGLRGVFASDIDEDARKQYQNAFGLSPAGDITQIDPESIPDHDILFGGFPCQPFSIIGDRGGLDDARGTLIFDIARILKAKTPQAFVLENVSQLATIRQGKTLQKVLQALTESGYTCLWQILNALDYGLPQKRERLIIIGFANTAHRFYSWPDPKPSYTPLSDLLETEVDARYYVSDRIRKKRKAAHTSSVIPSIWHENKGGNINSHPFSCALRAGASYNYLLVNGERRLTPREQLRLQGFPERFKIIGNDSQIRKQVGNAVPVPMIRAVIRKVLHAASQNAKQLQETRALSA